MVDVTCSDVVRDGVRIGKRIRGYVLTLYFFGCGAARNSLNTSLLTIFRVAVCFTLKMAIWLLVSTLRVAFYVSSWKKYLTKKSKHFIEA